MWQKKHPQLDLFNLLRVPEEDLEIQYEEFREVFKKVRKQIYLMKENKRINYASHLKGNLDIVIQRGIENTGVFHLNRPLMKNKKGNIVTKDLSLLYYYHNRLVGYDLEQFI
jgi:glycerol-3-phosphate O-acyltransferase